MCEQFIARSASPFRLDELWDYTGRLERFGIAGFGWGAAWIDPDGRLRSHRDIRAFRDDPARADVGRVMTTSALVHLRRPTRLSTIGPADTQPFDDPAGRFSFSHNGDLENWRAQRSRYRAAGRIRGLADSEVGARWLEDEWQSDAPVSLTLAAFHDTFGGEANLAILSAGGEVHHYAGNRENPVFSFRLGRIGLAGTGIYSLDRSVFRFAAPTATDRHLVSIGHTVALDPEGQPTLA